MLVDEEMQAISQAQQTEQIKKAILDENILELSKINFQDITIDNDPALIFATKNNKVGSILAILDKYYTLIYLGDNERMTALHWAAKLGHSAIISTLLLKHCNINAKNIRSETPLHLAVIHKNIIAIQLLVQAGADTQALDAHNKSPLDYLEKNSTEYHVMRQYVPQIKSSYEHLSFFFFDAIKRGIEDGKAKGRSIATDINPIIASPGEVIGAFIGFFPGVVKGLDKTQRKPLQPLGMSKLIQKLHAYPDEDKSHTIEAVINRYEALDPLKNESQNDISNQTLIKALKSQQSKAIKWANLLNYIHEGWIDQPSGSSLELSDGKYAYRNNGKVLFRIIVDVIIQDKLFVTPPEPRLEMGISIDTSEDSFSMENLS